MNLKGNHLKGFWTKKKILLVSLTLIFAIGAGVTTAYMWKQGDTKTATFGEAHVDCEVTTENNIYYVKNTGNVDCYVRVTFTVNFMDNEGNLHYTKPIAGTHYELVTSTSGNWIEGADGYWYYKEAISPKEKTLTGVVKVTPHNTNLPQGYSLKAIVNAEAVQALPEQYTNMTDDPAYLDAWASIRAQQQLIPNRYIGDLKVMSWNIRRSGLKIGDGYDADDGPRDWAKRKDAVVNYILAQNADIIILQEVTLYQRDDIKGVLEKYTNYSYTHRGYRSWFEDDITGMMIIFNTDKLEKLKYGTTTVLPSNDLIHGNHSDAFYHEEIEINTNPDPNRPLDDYYSMRFSLAFKLKNPPSGTPEDAILYVHDMHLDYNSAENQIQAVTELVKEIDAQKKNFPNSMHLVAGTFNSVMDGSVWKDTIENAGLFRCTPENDGETLNSWNVGANDLKLYAPQYQAGMAAIDYVFAKSEGIRSEGFTVDRKGRWTYEGSNQFLSSHYAVIGTVSLYAPLGN